MSPSKLESLPNEILIELFEKHINGIDIIKAFRFQLNKRIDSIILECRRFKFDFIKCYKTDFCFSMGLLPAYVDKVEQLALSEQNSPGQIHAFLASEYLSPFTSFTGLRKLYMNIIIDTVEPTILRQAFESLTKTNLHTLSIVINGTDSSRFFDSIIPKLFRMQTLKQLSIISNSTMERIDWQTIADYSSNIEYLTLKGVNCDFENTRHIFQCASGLKYVDLTLEANRYRRYNTTKQPNAQQVIQMSKLQTMIVKINGDTTSLRDSINSMFQLVPFLRRLEVRIDNSSFDVTIWENLVKNNLTKLSHFILQYNSFYLKEGDVKNILGIIEIPFWMERNDFHIILKKHTEESENSSDQYYLGSLENSSADDFRKFAEKWYVLPERQEKNSRFHPANQITNVTISRSLARNCDLNNVENLIIDQMDDNVLDLMQKHISFSTVKHLDISAVRNITKYISNILPSMINLRSLRLTANELNILKALPLTNLQKLTFIDLTMDKYPFSKDHANTLSTAFPNVEHLRVAPLNLSDVPILNTYFPKLHSLTFMPMGNQLDDDYKKQKFDFDLRRIMPFLFHRKAQWLTIWLDQDVYTGDIWQKSESGRIFNLNIKQSRYNPYSYYNNDDDDY